MSELDSTGHGIFPPDTPPHGFAAWFGAIYVFRCVPYVSWVLPLYFVTRAMGIFDTYWGLLLPHVAVHICFFSWIM